MGGAELMMGRLAAEFVRRELDVTVLTARWQRQWPAEMTYCGAKVVRLAQPATRFWGTLCYTRALGRWLRDHQGEYDLVYVSMLKHDAYAALGAVGKRVPVLVRAEGSGRQGDCVWQLDAWGGQRIKRRCMGADALVAPSPAILRELAAAGYPAERARYLPNGVRIPPPADAAAKAAARRALAESSPLLNCSADAPLAVYTGRLHEAKGLAELLMAWSKVVACRPSAQLWLVGEGPLEQSLREQVAERGLSGRVILPGVFDSVDEILQAADLYVFPSWSEGMSLALLEAMAAGLPIVASDIPGNRALISDEVHGLLVPVGDSAALAAAMDRLLEDRELGRRLGAAARRRTESEYSLGRSVEAHLTLFEELVRSRRVEGRR
jgi:glycosyltransferase involved in cell wall biosynthesis